MLCFKYSLLSAVLAFSAIASYGQTEKFTSKECLMAVYETNVTHKGDLWGLMKKDLAVKKDVCEIVVSDKGILETEWKVDVCREPIHIKSTSKGSLSVYKRKGVCGKTEQSDFCESWRQLRETLEDQGLIFAEGEREKLSTAHGKIYCAYLLLKKHLDEGVLFSKFQEPANIYGEKAPVKKSAPAQKVEKAPKAEEKVEAQGRF